MRENRYERWNEESIAKRDQSVKKDFPTCPFFLSLSRLMKEKMMMTTEKNHLLSNYEIEKGKER